MKRPEGKVAIVTGSGEGVGRGIAPTDVGKRDDVLANIICPAATTAAYEAFRAASPENAAEIPKQNPMGRMGDPERDIGGVAVFLASEDSRYVTGNTLFVDGGSHINGVSWAPELPE
jgi:NAD(P)-dependent dehydrogenase (short-subunit alcohol dehydrogenase family)